MTYNLRYKEEDLSEPGPHAQFSQTKTDMKKECQGVMPHYYGDIVRRLFIVGSIITLLTVPFFKSILPHPVYVPIIAAVIFGFVAAWTSPQQKIIAVVNALIAGIAVIGFEYYAANRLLYDGLQTLEIALRAVYLLLAIIFFFAFYYTVKTLRGYFLKK